MNYSTVALRREGSQIKRGQIMKRWLCWDKKVFLLRNSTLCCYPSFISVQLHLQSHHVADLPHQRREPVQQAIQLAKGWNIKDHLSDAITWYSFSCDLVFFCTTGTTFRQQKPTATESHHHHQQAGLVLAGAINTGTGLLRRILQMTLNWEQRRQQVGWRSNPRRRNIIRR